jgi:basic amino acid/polyamine antiporter, APA family
MSTGDNPSRLARRLRTTDAVFIGLGSMIGAGIFAAAGPAADAAGTGLLIGVLIAGVLAFLNAATMAQLAALYPESGGAYVYGRKRLGLVWGFLAGWGFVIGKLASCTAMALTFAYYAAPSYARPIAVLSVLVLTAVNYMGVRKTAFATKIIVGLVLFSLSVVVFAALSGGGADPSRLSGWFDRGGIPGALQAAGIMFFAFAGYARIATLGEEVIDPKATIPKAIVISLGVTLVIYLVVISAAVLSVDIEALAKSKAPLVLAVESGRFSFLSPLIRIGACLASLGVLLSLLAGVSRTAFAMAANRDLPHLLSAVHPVHKVPHRAELAVGIIVGSIVAVADLRTAIGFSSFAILTYYGIANAAALTLERGERSWPRWMSVAGFISCTVIAVNLPIVSVIGGVLVFGAGALYYLHNIYSQS